MHAGHFMDPPLIDITLTTYINTVPPGSSDLNALLVDSINVQVDEFSQRIQLI